VSDVQLTGDQTLCPKCKELFATTTAFQAHEANQRKLSSPCKEPLSAGLIAEIRGGRTWWVSPKKAPPRSPASMAFDRVLSRITQPRSIAERDALQADIEKVRQAIARKK